MKIEMAYRNGRVDVFDTMSFTAPSPLGKENALTNFELRFDELGKTGLWLAAHHYDVDPSGTEDCPDDETPIARRRRGWRFLLAEASELDELEWVAVDGELALARVLGEMVDVGQLMRSARLWLGTSNRSVAETIVHLFDELSTVSQADCGIARDAIPRHCGCSEELVYRLKAACPRESPNETETNNQEENWLEGFENEDY